MMDLYILNSSYEQIAVIDSYTSLIWTKRYYTCGDFELYLPADKNLLQFLQLDNFIIREDDDSVMIIEKLEIKTDVENGDFFIISGRSLESILLRRVCVFPVTINELNPIQGIKKIIDTCTHDIHDFQPGSIREIPGLIVDTSFLIEETLNAQFTGDTILKAITAICMRFGFGLKMILSDSHLILSFYKGEQVDVVFSQEFDNLISSSYTYDKTNFANFFIAMGEGEGTGRTWASWHESGSGITLRELYIDAKDISSNKGEISYDDYNNLLWERCREKTKEYTITKTFEAEIEPRMSFKYKEDYNLGDIVEVTTEYGITAHPRIVEIIESWNETGYTVIPTLEELEVN